MADRVAGLICEARRLLEQVPRDYPDVPLAIAAADSIVDGRFCRALAEVSPDGPPRVDIAAGNVVILLSEIGRRSLGDDTVRVAALLQRALVDLEEAVDEPDPRLRLTLLMMAAEPLIGASVDAATDRRWRFESVRDRRARRAYRLRGRLRPAPARRPRCNRCWRPRSSRGPPADDEEDPEGDGPSGTGRAG